MVKKLASLLASAVLLAAAPVSAYAAHAFSVEQIQSEMPEITVYVSSEKPVDTTNIEAMLDYEPLEVVSAEAFAESSTPICYYMLIDDSGSVSAAQMESVKKALGSMGSVMRAGDTITLISVGTLQTLYSGDKIDETYLEQVDSLKNNKQETFLYEAIDSVNKTISAAGTENSCRNVIIAFSDGLNEAVGKTSYTEITDALRKSGIPLYAMGIKGKNNENLEAFGELARSTGGDIISFEADECGSAFAQLTGDILSGTKLTLKASSNIIKGERTLLIKFPDENYSEEFKINPVKWIPDTSAPEITAFEKTADNQLTVTFSEAVNGADNIKNYNILCSEEGITLTEAVYSDNEGVFKAVLTSEEPLPTGEYTVETSGITDVSTEKNKLSNTASGSFEGTAASDNLPADIKDDNDSMLWIWIAVGAGVVIIGAIIVVFVMLRKSGGVITVDDKVMLGNGLKVKHHIHGENIFNRPVVICVLSADGNNREISVNIEKTLTVGRAQQNDVYFDDLSMSRYHFIIEHREGHLYIKDNESTSGTFINGERIGMDNTEIISGDTVSAGNTKMIFRW